ncbi:uncharacterized protein LOC118433291 [Folsomia candida]|uniref:Uncharacterized protein n=1 Tax=Folsomia candida TaxID=158441 RepID=A0A226CYL9_FOLCA|nr:uncharacterized protein LOC118433291 [Folsomia candida]OXA38415.1 hypothetical protein Fcan01_26823 [Folsomia candida]
MTEDTFSVWPRVIPDHLLYTMDEIWSEDCSRTAKLYDFQGPDERKQIYQNIAKCSPGFLRYNLKVAVTDADPPAQKFLDFNIEQGRPVLGSVERKIEIYVCYTVPVLAYHHHSKFDKEQMQHNCAMFPVLLLRQVGMKRGAEIGHSMPLSFSYGIL